MLAGELLVHIIDYPWYFFQNFRVQLQLVMTSFFTSFHVFQILVTATGHKILIQKNRLQICDCNWSQSSQVTQIAIISSSCNWYFKHYLCMTTEYINCSKWPVLWAIAGMCESCPFFSPVAYYNVNTAIYLHISINLEEFLALDHGIVTDASWATHCDESEVVVVPCSSECSSRGHDGMCYDFKRFRQSSTVVGSKVRGQMSLEECKS